MTAVTPDTRHEWTTRLAQAMVQSGYETDANIRPLVNEAIATDQTLAYLLISRKLALPSVVVGTMSKLSELPAVDLAAFTPQPEATDQDRRPPSDLCRVVLSEPTRGSEEHPRRRASNCKCNHQSKDRQAQPAYRP